MNIKMCMVYVDICNQNTFSVRYPQVHSFKWLSLYFSNNSFSLQYSANIWKLTKIRKLKKNDEYPIEYYQFLVQIVVVVLNIHKSFSSTFNILLFRLDIKTSAGKKVCRLNLWWTLYIIVSGPNSFCCIQYIQLFS